MKSVKVILQNPLNKKECVDYNIMPNDTLLASEWYTALKDILRNRLHLEKNYCFLGFPDNPRNLEYLCKQVNIFSDIINKNLPDYRIEEYFVPEAVMFDESYDNFFENNTDLIKHDILNRLHNHFEVLQGTVENISEYYHRSNIQTKYAIRQLNILCHEIETLCLSLKNKRTAPEWVRPSQITTFLNAPRLHLKDEHREGFLSNGYDREFGGVYMHWCQIGKTYWEVWKDEGAPKLTDTICEAITELQYYSGEFDIDWATTITYKGQDWRRAEVDEYYAWLDENNVDRNDPLNSLGYLPLGQIDIQNSFGTVEETEVWKILSDHLDICRIEVDDVACDYEYSWSDADHQTKQMRALGYIE